MKPIPSIADEEAVPLCVAGASAARDDDVQLRDQHHRLSRRRCSTIAFGLACAAVGASIALLVRRADDSSLRDADAGREAASLGSYSFTRHAGGNFSCPPVLSAEYQNAITDSETDREIEHKITPRECAWFGTAEPYVKSRARAPSNCVPENTLFVSIADAGNYELAKLSTANVQSKDCFMDRYIIVTLDAETQTKCQEEALFNCLVYLDGRAFEHVKGIRRYNVLTWLKQKVSLGLLSYGVDFFFFDTDVILFKVPDLAQLHQTNPEADLFYQQDYYGYGASLHGRHPYILSKEQIQWQVDAKHTAIDFNSGQLYWRASPATLKLQQIALNSGPGAMEQAVLADAANRLSETGEIKTVPLPVDGRNAYGTGCADVNALPGEVDDFDNPEVLRHMVTWTTLHSDCKLYKGWGMIQMNLRLKCLAKYHDVNLCVTIKELKDWQHIEDTRGATLGFESEAATDISELQLTKSRIQTMLARFHCAASATDMEDCSNILSTRIEDTNPLAEGHVFS